VARPSRPSPGRDDAARPDIIILEADGRVSESIKAIGRMRHPDGYPDAGRALEKIRAEGGRGDDTG
jgi:hypothetical protein